MSRHTDDLDTRLAQACIMQVFGAEDIDIREWMARTSRACDDRRPSRSEVA
jgi:hypothetical protein